VLYNGDVNIKDQPPVKRKYLTLMNPFGGGGGVLAKWGKANKILEKAHIEIVLKETER